MSKITFVFSLFKLALLGFFRAPLFLLRLSTTFLVLLSSRQTFVFSCALWYLLHVCASLRLFALVQDAGAQVLQVRLTPAWHQQSRPLAHVHGFVCVLQLFSNVLSNRACDVGVLQFHQTLGLVRWVFIALYPAVRLFRFLVTRLVHELAPSFASLGASSGSESQLLSRVNCVAAIVSSPYHCPCIYSYVCHQ